MYWLGSGVSSTTSDSIPVDMDTEQIGFMLCVMSFTALGEDKKQKPSSVSHTHDFDVTFSHKTFDR